MDIMNIGKNNINYGIIILIYLTIPTILIAGLAHAAVIEVNSGQCIQKAIDLANPGDTIRVFNGTYTENIQIDSGIVLQNSSGNRIFYNDARNGGTGIFLRNSCDNTIEGNKISSYGKDSLGVSYGIYLLNSSNHNVIRRNIIDIGGPING